MTGVMTRLLKRFLFSADGQDLIEYALLASFISLAAYAGVNALGSALTNFGSNVVTEVEDISDAVTPSPSPTP